jgi:NitT/TauT family transport system substrate-binding protein
MTHSLSRKSFVAGSAATFASINVARAQTHTTIRCSSAPDDDCASVLYGIDSGMFAREGLDVTIAAGNSGAAISAGVLGGSIDLGKSSVVALIVAHAKGLPIQLVAGASLYDSNQKIVDMIVARDSSIQSPKDLPGKVISVSALNDLYSIAASAYVDHAGAAWRDVKYVELPSASAPAALIAHRIDAVTLTTPALSMALATGKVRIVGYPYNAIADHFVRAGWFATKDYVSANADAIARFRHVVKEAAAFVNANPAKLTNLLASFTKQEVDLIAKSPRSINVGPVEPKLLQPVIDCSFKYGAIAASFASADMLAPGAA